MLMRRLWRWRLVAGTALLAGCTASSLPLASEAVIAAAERAPLSAFARSGRWNDPYPAFTVYGNVHYVGTAGVSAWLVTTPKGHILIGGIMPQSVSIIAANVKALGFRIEDVRYLLNSHAHIDHAGGLAGLKRLSGATMIASAADKPFLEAGDIGFGPSGGMKFPPVRVDRVIADGDIVSLGGVTLTARLTPGHSPGCTTWQTDAVSTDGQRRSVLFHCSATVAGQSLAPEAYPGIVADFRASFTKLRGMKADIFLANHDNFFNLGAKRARLAAGNVDAFVDPGEVLRFADKMEAAFEAELTKPQAAAQ